MRVDMQLVSKTWWIVGIYRHVAKPGDATRRRRLLKCLAVRNEKDTKIKKTEVTLRADDKREQTIHRRKIDG